MDSLSFSAFAGNDRSSGSTWLADKLHRTFLHPQTRRMARRRHVDCAASANQQLGVTVGIDKLDDCSHIVRRDEFPQRAPYDRLLP
jgi:hypothetical protein